MFIFTPKIGDSQFDYIILLKGLGEKPPSSFPDVETQEALPMLEASTKDPYQQLDVTSHDLGPPEGR